MGRFRNGDLNEIPRWAKQRVSIMKENLTLLEAYKAMYSFLDNYYLQMDKPDEIGALLGGLRILPDGTPVDPAAWTDWVQAVQKISDAEGHKE